MPENKEAGIEELREILQGLEGSDAEDPGYQGNLLRNVRKGMRVLRFIGNLTSEGGETDHVANYCRIKMEHARKQIEYGDIEEGVQFARAIIKYYLRETEPGSGQAVA